jgi:uncharacterized membrane protein
MIEGGMMEGVTTRRSSSQVERRDASRSDRKLAMVFSSLVLALYAVIGYGVYFAVTAI